MNIGYNAKAKFIPAQVRKLQKDHSKGSLFFILFFLIAE